MHDPVSRAVDPAQDAEISRELLAQMDEAATSREHWKILAWGSSPMPMTCSSSVSPPR